MARTAYAHFVRRNGVREEQHGSILEWPEAVGLILKLVGILAMGIWTIRLIALSNVLYHRDFLAEDFATYNQAWTLIGTGHLNPFDTIFGSYTFLKSDFELIIWPLALIHLVYPKPVVLLWIQDICVSGSGLVAYIWITEFLKRRQVDWRVAIGIAILVLSITVANPGAYQTVLFDVHMEPISTLFILLAARDLWLGKHRRFLVWTAVALLCGTFAAITVIGLGLSALLAGRQTRRHGLGLMVGGVAWLGLVSVIGANAGSGIGNYAYLVANQSTGPVSVPEIIRGMLSHPSRVIHQLRSRAHDVYVLLKPVGTVGVVCAWGFGIPLVVLLTNSLNGSELFIFEAFQNFVVFPFVLIGTVMVFVWLAQRFRFGWVPATIVALLLSAQALSYGVSTSPGDIRYFEAQVPSGPASQIRQVLATTPSDAEVIMSVGIMGRFASRPSIYFVSAGGLYPIRSRVIFFVFDPARDGPVTGLADSTAIRYVRTTLHARILLNSQGISAYEWHPAPSVQHLQLPLPPGSAG